MASSKSTKSPAFQFYPRDFLSSAKVDAMPMTERGVYITLLARCWLDNGLPTDMKTLATMARMKESAFERMWSNSQLGKCFHERGGKLHNERLDSERKKQVDFKRRQSDNGKLGGRPKKPEETQEKAVGSSGLTQPKPTESSSSSSSSASSSAPAGTTHRQGGAPLHQSHKAHAACGRVCVPGDLHGQFVRARNHQDADRELRDWYLAVDNEWSIGARKDENPGGNDYRFWRSRFDERWPVERPQRIGTAKTARNVEELQDFVNRGRTA